MSLRKRCRRSVSKRDVYEHHHTVVYEELDETKTTMFFCFISHRGVMFQMMYYDQEGLEKKDIYTNLDEKDKEWFVHYFTSVLQRRNIPDYMIERLVEEVM